HQPANPALARCILQPQPVRIRPLVYELHPFFAMTAFSISASLCLDLDPPLAFSTAYSRPAIASPPAPRSHPSRRTLLSRHRWCASTRPPPAPHLPLCAPPLTASAPRSSAPPCACSSTYPLPLSILDDRRGKNTRLPLPDLLRQSIYSRLAGYEDLNDAERLSQDPTFRLIGSEKIWDRG